MFEKVDPKQSFPEMEKKILKYWGENEIFEKSVENRKDNEKFVFFPLIYTVSPFQRFRWQRISRMRDENLRNELNSIELDHALIQGLNPDSNLGDDRYKEFTKRLMYEQSVPLTENLRVSNEKVKPDSYSVSEAYEKIDSIRNKEKKQLDDYLYEDILNDKFTPKKYG